MTQRREVFDRMLFKSVYRVNFEFEGQIYPAIFERYKQDESQTLKYLFTQYDLNIKNGTILFLPDPIGKGEITDIEKKQIVPKVENKIPGMELEFPETSTNKPFDDGEPTRPWMVYYLEDNGAKGYNRYVLLKMTHLLYWKDRDKIDRESYAYMYGQEDNMLKDELRSRSRMDPLYTEALKMSFFVMPANEHIRKDDYFIIDKDINNKALEEYYRVTGYDIQSQDGVEYVTVDPIYEYSKDYYDDTIKDNKPVIEKQEEETEQHFQKRQDDLDAEYFWLKGGSK